MVIYLDDIIGFSRLVTNHANDLKQVFERCKKYGISLNPKKSYFALDEGKFLGFIVSMRGIYIDLERIEEIKRIHFPHNKKNM